MDGSPLKIMGRRDVAISAAITQGIQGREVSSSWWTSIITFFAVLHVGLCRYRDELFRRLRVEAWQMDEDEYQESFQVKGNVGGAKERDQGPLRPVGEMGYSGSVGQPSSSMDGRGCMKEHQRSLTPHGAQSTDFLQNG